MLRQRILLKFSDVFQTKPDAAAYYAQVRRCPGDIPLNVFGTVNGYWSAGEAALEAQRSLEHEFAGGIVGDMLARFRMRLSSRRDSLIFTRASGLLNLKVLLAVPRSEHEFLVEPVGLMGLHANDYTDISLTAPDAELFAVQNMPVWEAHNPRDIANLLARYYFISQTIYAQDDRVVALFKSEFGTSPSTATIDGLPFDDYFALLFGLYTAASAAGRDQKTAILKLEEHLELLGLPLERVNEFVASRVANEDQFMKRFGRLDTSEAFREHVNRPNWALDFSAFREHPLLRLRDGRVLVLDLQFLIENASVGMFWNVCRRMSAAGRDRLLAYWGTAFERYVKRQMEAHVPNGATLAFNVDPQGFETDALLTQVNDVFVFEVKAGSLPQSAKCSRDVRTVREAIERKFVANAKGNPKGVTQLAERCNALAKGKGHGRIYPVLVVDEQALQTPGVNTYLARRFHALLNKGERVGSLAIVTGDELELMLPYIAAGDITWKELLDTREEGNAVTAKPVSTTFWEIAATRKLRTRSSRILGPTRNHLAELVRKRYEHLK